MRSRETFFYMGTLRRHWLNTMLRSKLIQMIQLPMVLNQSHLSSPGGRAKPSPGPVGSAHQSQRSCCFSLAFLALPCTPASARIWRGHRGMQALGQSERVVLERLFRSGFSLWSYGAIGAGAAGVSRIEQDPTKLHCAVVPSICLRVLKQSAVSPRDRRHSRWAEEGRHGGAMNEVRARHFLTRRFNGGR